MLTLWDVTSGWNAPRTLRREWIAPPNPPDENTIEGLREILRAEPRVVEAWVVGSRRCPVEGSSPPRESSDIALVLDPLLDPLGNEQQIDMFMALMEKLDAGGQGRGTGRGFLIVSRKVIASHRELATRIYSRPDPTPEAL
jgi:hypothetical protein